MNSPTISNELTREELFLLVWERPTRDVAKELGISDVALGKPCKPHILLLERKPDEHNRDHRGPRIAIRLTSKFIQQVANLRRLAAENSLAYAVWDLRAFEHTWIVQYQYDRYGDLHSKLCVSRDSLWVVCTVTRPWYDGSEKTMETSAISLSDIAPVELVPKADVALPAVLELPKLAIWHIGKQVLGHRIHESTGTSELKTAELMLARRIEQIRQAAVFGIRPVRIFREAATRFLEENTNLATIHTYAFHLKELDPYIGELPLYQVHMGTLQGYIDRRKKEGKKNKTVNGALATVRRVLNLSARLWRDEHGLTWLESAPLIQLLPLHDARRPYPLSWEEQHRLFRALPDHLSRMCLFKVNTGCRDGEVCGLQWDWEIDVPELGTSVFLIPGEKIKNREHRLVVLNRVAKSVIDGVRGQHPERVFTYYGRPVRSINNNGWKSVRRKLDMPIRVHDLKHTFGRRLRAAGVPLETRKILLGHKNGDITTHYSAPELEELIEAANRVCEGKSGKTPALVVLKHRTVSAAAR